MTNPTEDGHLDPSQSEQTYFLCVGFEDPVYL